MANDNIVHGFLPQQIGGIVENDMPVGVLDTATVSYLTSFSGWREQLASLGIAKRMVHPGFPGMYVKDFKTQQDGDLRKVTLPLEGVLTSNGDKRVRTISAFGSIISIGPIEKVHIVDEADGVDEDGNAVTAQRRVPELNDLGEVQYKTIAAPVGTAERWNVNDPAVTVIDTYFSTTAPVTTQIGTNVIPVNAPAVTVSGWGGLDVDLRANYPNGWVLDNRESEQLYGSVVGGDGLWKIVDTHEYYQAVVPD